MKNNKHEKCNCTTCNTEGAKCTTGKCTCGKTCTCDQTKATIATKTK